MPGLPLEGSRCWVDVNGNFGALLVHDDSEEPLTITD